MGLSKTKSRPYPGFLDKNSLKSSLSLLVVQNSGIPNSIIPPRNFGKRGHNCRLPKGILEFSKISLISLVGVSQSERDVLVSTVTKKDCFILGSTVLGGPRLHPKGHSPFLVTGKRKTCPSTPY